MDNVTVKTGTLDAGTRRRMRRIAHHLDPVIIVGGQGISEALVAETTRALRDHELIKVRIQTGDRAERQQVTRALADACEADVVQTIGKITVLLRHNPEPDPKLSNLSRFGG